MAIAWGIMVAAAPLIPNTVVELLRIWTQRQQSYMEDRCGGQRLMRAYGWAARYFE